MKTKVILRLIACAAMGCIFGAQADELDGTAPRKVALIVQNHAAPGASIPFMALTDALTAKLSGCGLQVVNPYNSVGVNQNRTASGERTPGVSAMELARQLKADGAITASVLEFREQLLGSSPVEYCQYSMRITLNLADAQTGATVCGETIKCKSLKYAKSQVAKNKQQCLSDLMYAAADECAVQLKKSPGFLKWMKTSVDDSRADGLTERLKQDASFRKWIESIIDERLSKRMEDDSKNRVPALSFDKIVDELADMMAWDEQFTKSYKEEQKKNAGRLPIAIIGNATNETKRTEFDAGLRSSGRRFRDRLRTSGRFDVKDDAVIVNLATRITESRKNGLETGDLMKVWETHGSPDFFVVVSLNDKMDLDGSTPYEYNITMHSLRSGLIVWSGTKEFNLNREAAK